jgi:hypothetical protein
MLRADNSRSLTSQDSGPHSINFYTISSLNLPAPSVTMDSSFGCVSYDCGYSPCGYGGDWRSGTPYLNNGNQMNVPL